MAAAILAVVAIAAPALADDDIEDGRPQIWAGTAVARGIHYQVDKTSGLLIVPEPLYATVADGFSQFGSSANYARAGTYYPGAAATKGPNLLCGQAPLPPPICPFPAFPLYVEAGNQPDVKSTTTQQVGGGGTTLTAVAAVGHADRKYVSSDATVTGVDLAGTGSASAASLNFRRQAALIAGGPLAAKSVQSAASDNSAVHVDSSTAHTRQDFDPKNKALLHVVSTVDMKGISLGGGMIHIDSLFSTSSYNVDGQQVKDHKSSITLGGVTAGGQPATIDNNGISINGGGQGKPAIDALNAALQQALKAAGGNVFVAKEGTPTDIPECAQGTSDGLHFHEQQDLGSVPQEGGVYFVDFTLGTACTDAAATSERIDKAADAGLGSSDASVEGSSSDAGAPPANIAPADAAPLLASVPAPTVTKTKRSRQPKAATRVRRRRTGSLEADLAGALITHRWNLFYLSFTLAAIGLLLGSRLLVGPPWPLVRSRPDHAP